MLKTIEEIKEQFKKVIAYSQTGIDDPQVDELFEAWDTKKCDFYDMFGEKLIYEVPEKVCFELDEQTKSERLGSFITYMWASGYDDLGRFLEHQKDGFFKNVVVEEYQLYDDKKTVITKNSKLTKAFKHFIKNEKVLNDLQIKASRLIQENKIEGKLCFSIHPLDYLSISENGHNWRSCHALDGEYRAGNISYMMDSSTIVCYLKSDNDIVLPNFPEDVLWNSKKWRVLLYFSQDWKMIFAGKQYPFSSPVGMNLVLEWLNKNAIQKPHAIWYDRVDEDSYWLPWSDWTLDQVKKDDVTYHFYNGGYIPVKNKLVKTEDLVKDAKGSQQFNDVLKSSCYKPMYTQLVYASTWNDDVVCYANEDSKFTIGGKTKCLRCGKEEVLFGSSTMMCYDCEWHYGTSESDAFCYCEECDTRIPTEEGYYVGDRIYCKQCYDEYTVKCDSCGDAILRENAYYDEVNDTYLCKWCREED